MWDCSSVVKDVHHDSVANSSFNVDEHLDACVYLIPAEAVKTYFGALTFLLETGISNFRVIDDGSCRSVLFSG